MQKKNVSDDRNRFLDIATPFFCILKLQTILNVLITINRFLMYVGYVSIECDVFFCLDACDPNPCGQNGNCERVVNGYECNCQNGYSGLNCDTGFKAC